MKRINGEPVKLVESFDELRTGMIVWVAPCPAPDCDKHRGILLDEMPAQPTVSVKSGRLNLLSGFSFVPPVHGAVESMLTEADVAHRAVYRVVDEKLDGETTTERAPRELERTR